MFSRASLMTARRGGEGAHRFFSRRRLVEWLAATGRFGAGPERARNEEAAIGIFAAPFALAFVAWLATLLAARTGGAIRLAAQTIAVILASLAGALAGFLIPLAPLPDLAIAPALLAGILGTLGTIAGMALAEWLLAKLDPQP